MVKTLFAIMLSAFTVASSLQSYCQSSVCGRVSSHGKGIRNVVVTDGFSTTLTDKKGDYSLSVHPLSKFVYISTPSGYSAPLNGENLPQFFQKIEGRNANRVNFLLDRDSRGDSVHRIVFWADPQVRKPSDMEQLRDAVSDLKDVVDENLKYAYFGIGCGDIVFDNLTLFGEYNAIAAKAGIPFYHALGNHDMDYNKRSDEGSSASFEKAYGPTYYSFNKGSIHYVVLDNVFYIGRDHLYIGYLTAQQQDWLKKDLSYLQKGSTVIIVLHIPSALDANDLAKFDSKNINASLSNKEALYSLLEPFNAHIVSGHTHTMRNVSISGNIYEHNVSSVCGSWWNGPVAQDGSPKGYLVLEANGDNLKWYYKSIGFPLSHQMRFYPIGANSEQPEYITVNVWGWDWDWKVYWYEDDVRMGEMERYSGLDPFTLEAYRQLGDKKPKWFGPLETDHLFKAKPRSSTAKVKVEVVDRFGNSYWAE